MNIQYKPTLDLEPEEEVGTRDYMNALVNQNVTFAKRLTTPYYGSQPEEGFNLSSDKSKEILDRYNVQADEYSDYLDISSTIELENKLKYKQSSKQEAEIIANSGVGGIAASFVVGALDPVGWAIGGVAGKTAQLASKAYNLSSKGIRYSQAAAGSIGAIGSAGALEYSLDGELSNEALAVNAILGFGIGFGTAGGMLNKSVVDGLENTAQYGVEASPYKKIDLMLDWMHSSAERAKTSDNPLMRELGYKTSRSMKDVGLQGGDTANDMLSDYNQILNNYKENFDNLKTDYKKKYGKDFTSNDEKELIRVLHEIDNEHTVYKDNIYNEQLNKIRQEKAIELENKYRDDYDLAQTSSDKTKLTKKKNKEMKKLESYKPDDAKLKEINAMAREQGSKNIDNIINSKNEKIIPFIKSYKDMTKKYGDELIKHDLHGMKDDIDNSWYATRAFDADKIDSNKEGAVEAFKQGLASNLKEVNDDTMVELEKYARDIVNNITTAKADYNAFDADLNVIKKAIGKTKIKTGALKGRKLKVDASKLIDFMQDDIIHTASAYSRRVGGELAVKRSLGIDDINTIEKVIKDKQITGKDKELLTDMAERIKGTSEIDPNSNSVGSRIVRGFNQLNYINFGGWFGVNTMTDLSNIVNDFGLSRTMKYATNDIMTALSQGDARQSKRLARTLGLAAESLTNDRAILMGGESFGQGKHFLGEKQLSWMSNKMSQLSGMNMTIDFMDRVVTMSSLDIIMTGNMRDVKFQKTMNRLGLSSKEISAIRKSGIANVKADGLHNVNLDKLDVELRANLERAIKRAARDTVLRANEIDSPKFLTEVLGSKSLAKALFQFMRFPTVAYNKLGIKMKENWDTADAAVATIVAASILTLTNQAKDIGKDKPRYDLSTKEGIKNNTISIVERLPHMSIVAMPQSYVDILGRLGSSAIGEDYKGRPSVNTGITMDRISDVATTGGNLLSFRPKTSDMLTAASFVPFGNLFYLQAFNNMARDEIKGSRPQQKVTFSKEDIERYSSGN